MPLLKPKHAIYGRLINKDKSILQKRPVYDNSRLDLEVEGLKQRIDCNIKRHMDIRCEIRTEIDKLRQENMDLAAMLHRPDETFYLHQDFHEEVHRLRSMNVRLKAMLCLQDVKSIETYGPTKSYSTYPKYAEKRQSHSALTTSCDSEQDTHSDMSGHSRDVFARINKLEAGMKNFLAKNSLLRKDQSYKQKHVSDVDIQCPAERAINIQSLTIDDQHTPVETRDANLQTSSQKCNQPGRCHTGTTTAGYLRQSQRTHPEIASHHHIDGPHTQSTFWNKDGSLAHDQTNSIMKSSSTKRKNVSFSDINMPIMDNHWSAESASSDDRDVNMNSSRSEVSRVLLDNRDMISINSRSKREESIPQHRYSSMRYRSDDTRVLSDDKDINTNSPRKLERMLVMVHPKRSKSGTIVGFDVAENFDVKSSDNRKNSYNETVALSDYKPVHPVLQNGVSKVVPNFIVDKGITVEDVEIRDIYKKPSNDTVSDQSTSSQDMTLKFVTPFKVVATKHIRPRDVPRLNLGDLVSESDINLVKVTKETIENLLSDQDESSDVSYIDLSDGSGCQHPKQENLSDTNACQHNQRYCSVESQPISVVDDTTVNKDEGEKCDCPRNVSDRKVNITDMIRKLCENDEMSYMQDFFCENSAENPSKSVNDHRTPTPELELSTKHFIDEGTNTCENSTWNKLDPTIKLSSSVSKIDLEEDIPQMKKEDVDGSAINGDEDVPVTSADDEEARYAHYMELCNTTMWLTSIIKNMCANRITPNKQEFLQHPEEPRSQKCGGRDDVSEINKLQVPVEQEPVIEVVKPVSIPQPNRADLPSQSDADGVNLNEDNFPWMFPNTCSLDQHDNEQKKSKEKNDTVKGKKTIQMAVPTCTMDSARSDVSCIDLSLHAETPNLGSTETHAVKRCFDNSESPRCGAEERHTSITELACDVMGTGRIVVPSELELSCKRHQLLSTSLSKSHEDIVRLLNWTDASKYVGVWKDTECSKITHDQNSVQDILNSPDSMVIDSQRKNLWKPCFLSNHMLQDDQQAKPYYDPENNTDSARSGYDLDSDLSCIDLSEEVTSMSAAPNGLVVKEFLGQHRDEMNDFSDTYSCPRSSTSVTSCNKESYYTDTEGSCCSYYTASEDDSGHEDLASPYSLAGYARRDCVFEEDFVANFMHRSSLKQQDKEEAMHLIKQANSDIDQIHAIRIPILLGQSERLSKELFTSNHETKFDAMDSARSDVSCIELSKEEPTLSDIKEGHVVKEFLMCDEDKPGLTENKNDTLQSGRWAQPTNHKTYKLAAIESSSDDQVVISDIENDDDGSDVTYNDVTSMQAFSDTDSCVFDMDHQNDGHLPAEQGNHSTTPVLPFDNKDVFPRMSDVKKHGPRFSFNVWREMNLKLEKIKQDLVDSSRMSKWLIP